MPAEGSGPATSILDGPRITLLGPQRRPRVKKVVDRLGLGGRRFATITAGWRDRESDDTELNAQLGDNTVNLRLWALMQQVWEADPELAAADQRRRVLHTEMQELYLIGLEQAAEAIRRIRAHEPRAPHVVETAIVDVMEVMRELDQRHLTRVAELNAEFYETYEPQHRQAVVEARFRVGRAIAGCDAIAITGGHVGVLLGALHLFNLGPALAMPADPDDDESTPTLLRPVLAWGAGAMTLTERVLLFYDNAVSRPGVSEMLMDGLCLTRGIVALPSPRARLEMHDVIRMSQLARRAAPAQGLLLEERVDVTLTADGRLPAGTTVLGLDGRPTTTGEETA